MREHAVPIRLARRLGYVTLQVHDLDAAIDMFVNQAQLQLNERADDAAYLGSAGAHHWVILRSDPGAEEGLTEIAFELDPAVTLEAASDHLREAGVPFERVGSVSSDRVRHRLCLADPDGFGVVLFRGMLRAPGPSAPRWVHLERVLHTAISVSDVTKSLHFYTEVVGLRESDWIEDTSVFLHATDRAHHSLVLQARPGKPRADHFCMQTQTFDDLMRARAVVKSAGLTLRDDLLKHAPSGSVGFYFEGLPPGLGIEFCHGHATVAPDHVAGTYARVLQAKDVWQPPTADRRRADEQSGPEPANAPLRGIRVLDLTGTMSGPFCTLLMAQLGARVDKIEPPAGDIVRSLMRGRHAGMTPIFLALNAGKRSAVLDLSRPGDRARLTALFPRYDVIVHNMRAAAAARIGLTEDGLRSAGSDAVLCEIAGFGTGPYADRPAYDDTIQAISGMAWLQGRNGRPEYVRSVVADKTAGLYAAVGVCAALAGRARGAPIRSVRVPMFETMVAYTMLEQLGGLTFEPPEGPALYPRATSAHRRPFATADGYVAVMLYTDRHWSAFLTWLGRDDLLADPKFTQTAARSLAIDEVYGFLARVLTERTTREWLEVFSELDVPASPVLSFDSLLADPHLAAVGTIVTEEHPTEGLVRRVRTPITFNGEPPPGLAPAPRLGADTEQILGAEGRTPELGVGGTQE